MNNNSMLVKASNPSYYNNLKNLLKDIFKDTFKKHTPSDKTNTLVAGLDGFIPDTDKLFTGWMRPWMYMRLLIIGVLISLANIISIAVAGANMGSLAVLITVSSAVIPLAMLVFIWELNVPRNISMIEWLVIMLAGGVCCFLITSFISTAISMPSDKAYLAPISEEPAKFIMVAFFLRKPKYRWGLNGILIGAAVGAGFAIMESIGYAINPLISLNPTSEYFNYELDATMSLIHQTVIVRGILSIGGHTAWAALYGGAISLARNVSNRFTMNQLLNPRVILSFCTAFILHMTWNSNSVITKFLEKNNMKGLAVALNNYYIIYIALIIIVWVALLFIIRDGMRQAASLSASGAAVEISDNGKPSPTGYAHPVVSASHKVVSDATSSSDETRTATKIELNVCGFGMNTPYIFDEGKTILLGRGVDCDIKYPAEAREKGISTVHCKITVKDNCALLEDAGSKFGTYYRSSTRMGQGETVTLHNGDEFSLGYVGQTVKVKIITG